GLGAVLRALGSGSVLAAAFTGSPNPAAWGQSVAALVATCRGQLSDRQHGIGGCVGSAARLNGEQQDDAHAAGGSEKAHRRGEPTAEPSEATEDRPQASPNPQPRLSESPEPGEPPGSGGSDRAGRSASSEGSGGSGSYGRPAG